MTAHIIFQNMFPEPQRVPNRPREAPQDCLRRQAGFRTRPARAKQFGRNDVCERRMAMYNLFLYIGGRCVVAPFLWKASSPNFAAITDQVTLRLKRIMF